MCHNPQKYVNTIDLNRSLLDYIKTVPYFQTEFFKKHFLNNILTVSVNQGGFLRSSTCKRLSNCWVPGLNTGIPFTKKESDPIHELTYQFHDFSHFNIPDLVYTGNNTDIGKLVYIGYRLMSESITLVMADMIFVNSIFESGNKYETVEGRKIYKILSEILKNRELDEELLYNILKGSYEFTFYSDCSRWESMMDDKSSIVEFSEKYKNFFMADFFWTSNNYNYMKKTPEIYNNWWNNISPLRSFGKNLELQSVDEFIEEMNYNNINNQLNSSLKRKILDDTFELIYSKYIKRIYISKFELYTEDDQFKNRFLRYMFGQSLIFFSHPDQYNTFSVIKSSLEKINLPIAKNIRKLYNFHLKQLELSNIITRDDFDVYSEIYPIFELNFVSYNNNDYMITHKDFVNNILGLQ